mmetsp:Transcript_2265/g.3305  ORF Transcript_2265/g.3305 Transcript_2265/m.3305 type:complete len:316 (+) Transcript_2265:1903-2850(+)|eukprot:CAMPEP_0203754560 /NCGR_PEP_ID=MMETSP0098-20131031/8146_1 /ASSEMBLY_ACC=CAM_ASM_000208 /TAXON_ID=96639 /ORGANISM=" , Strain NY0313808BC1" /LENGTH=315 /DNA_ID=CAMNT_0050645639 /DNA_START=1864 /DNA_END=2811 /DNA_ORIENTATION=-
MSSLVGTHTSYGKLKQDVKEKEECCGTGHGDHGQVDEDEIERDYGEHGRFEMDPGLAQCCIQEMEDNRKYNKIMKTLREVDPVAKAVQRAETSLQGMTIEERPTAKAWMLENVCAHDAHASSDDESDWGSDFEDDEILKKMCEERMKQQSQQVSRCSNDAQLASFFRSSSGNKVVLFSDESTLSRAILESITRLVAVQGMSRFSFVCFPFETIGTMHALFNSMWFRENDFKFDPPFVVVYSQSSVEPITGFPKETLQKDKKIVETWCTNYTCVGKAVDSEGEDEEPNSYCGKAGCDRTFPHKHFQRAQQSDGELD